MSAGFRKTADGSNVHRVYTGDVRFEWNPEKAAANLKKHRVTFEEAVEAFADPNAVEIYDSEHSGEEPRFNLIGYSHSRLLFIVFTEKEEEGETVRNLISAR